jgi:cobalt-zinc-cadmium efflux system membrane fusion protein
MQKETVRFGWIAVSLAAVLWTAGGCGKNKDEASKGQERHDGQGHGAHASTHGAEESGDSDAGHTHAKEGAGQAAAETDPCRSPCGLTVDQILAARCEHKMPTYECAECRYELGVARLDASLLKERSASGIVRLDHAARRPVGTTVTVTGTIGLNENRTAHVTPRLAGVIRSVRADLGARVKAGETLLEVDSVELGEAVAEYERTGALAALATKQLERETSLWERKIAPETDVIEARMRLEELQTARRAAEQKLHVLGLSEGDVTALKPENHAGLSGTLPVRAAMDGTVLERHATVGEAVSPDRELMVLADTTTLWAWLDMHDRDLARAIAAHERGPIPVEVHVRAFQGVTFTGRVERIGATMDETTRTVKARAEVDSAGGRLRPGMFCEARIRLADERAALTVPKLAVVSDEGVDFVFTPLKDDYFRRVNVRKGVEFGDAVEIVAGLAEGETVVTEGAFLLKSDVLRSKMGAGCAD